MLGNNMELSENVRRERLNSDTDAFVKDMSSKARPTSTLRKEIYIYGTKRLEKASQAVDVPAGGVESGTPPCFVRMMWCFMPARWQEPRPVEARILSYVSMGISILACLIGFIMSYITMSSAMLAFALENLVDVLSSFVVIWRFSESSAAQNVKIEERELRASVGIGLSFLLTGAVVLVDSTMHLTEREAIKDASVLLWLSIPSCILLGAVGLVKVYVAKKLHSGALFEDGICSLGSSTISMSIWISIIVHDAHPRVWYIDGVVAFVIGAGFVLYGLYIVRCHRWWTPAFWRGAVVDGKVHMKVYSRDQYLQKVSNKPPLSFGEGVAYV